MPKDSYKLKILVKAPLPFTNPVNQENPFETVDVICQKYRSLNRDLSDLECIECALEIISAIWSTCGPICIYHIEPHKNGYIYRYNSESYLNNGDRGKCLMGNTEIYVGRNGSAVFAPRAHRDR